MAPPLIVFYDSETFGLQKKAAGGNFHVSGVSQWFFGIPRIVDAGLQLIRSQFLSFHKFMLPDPWAIPTIGAREITHETLPQIFGAESITSVNDAGAEITMDRISQFDAMQELERHFQGIAKAGHPIILAGFNEKFDHDQLRMSRWLALQERYRLGGAQVGHLDVQKLLRGMRHFTRTGPEDRVGALPEASRPVEKIVDGRYVVERVASNKQDGTLSLWRQLDWPGVSGPLRAKLNGIFSTEVGFHDAREDIERGTIPMFEILTEIVPWLTKALLRAATRDGVLAQLRAPKRFDRDPDRIAPERPIFLHANIGGWGVKTRWVLPLAFKTEEREDRGRNTYAKTTANDVMLLDLGEKPEEFLAIAQEKGPQRLAKLRAWAEEQRKGKYRPGHWIECQKQPVLLTQAEVDVHAPQDVPSAAERARMEDVASSVRAAFAADPDLEHEVGLAFTSALGSFPRPAEDVTVWERIHGGFLTRPTESAMAEFLETPDWARKAALMRSLPDTLPAQDLAVKTLMLRILTEMSFFVPGQEGTPPDMMRGALEPQEALAGVADAFNTIHGPADSFVPTLAGERAWCDTQLEAERAFLTAQGVPPERLAKAQERIAHLQAEKADYADDGVVASRHEKALRAVWAQAPANVKAAYLADPRNAGTPALDFLRRLDGSGAGATPGAAAAVTPQA